MKIGLFYYVVFALFLFSSCSKKASDNKTSATQNYPELKLSKQSATLSTTYPVTLRGKVDVEIRPRVDGFIEAVYIDEGAVVKKGQVLFKINSPSSEQMYLSAKASLNSAQAQLNTSKLDVERIRPLAEKGIVSNVQLQMYENAYQSALASLEQAKATLMQAEATKNWATVTSPVDGIVGTIPFRIGSLVNSTSSLTTVANTSNIYAYFSMNEKVLSEFLNTLDGETQKEKIKNAPELTLRLADGSTYAEKGKLETISGVVNVTTGSANFRAVFPNRQGLLKSGTSGKIDIPRIMDNVLIIPQAATFAQQDKVLTFKVQGDSVVQKNISVIALNDGKNYVVTDGLADGDVIVESGVATLFNGKKIK
ncbi:efflux RND transporter periplasmic adaptor subunit [Massilibacteroides sp.]|uniref:efflux RND transporter periplasmic adaptor subunit n=1 Tax=Massilibacteroides sp. TaxID=2034766 RepID=UPI002629A50C|nr:efflux RND transporter periplasmic adaptor subunit [Massilibacteroides sp.]MDD4515484.1 efflux RND transporter periplasmic adaptor subunit [Massilibacteroides sp.]